MVAALGYGRVAWAFLHHRHEHNDVFDTRHPDFARMRLVDREDFAFDLRMKAAAPE